MTMLLPRNFRVPKQARLDPLSIDDFGGGLNAVDSDIAMDSRYCPVLNNFRRTPSGSRRLRFGNNWFADVVSEVDGSIIDSEYFSDLIIAVTANGEVASIDDDGVVAAIWNDAIAALLLGAPDGWSTGLTTVDFVPFKDRLIIHNGVDKPISINSNAIVTYLQDEATGSNVNVPIGKYGCVVSNYHCVAGIAASPNVIYVSALGTAGTFPGDPAPNDSITIDVGAYAPEGAPEIVGIAGFRSNLIVFFSTQSLVIELGNYQEDPDDPTVQIHVPQFPDALPAFGLLNHRCIIQVEKDLLFAYLGGIASVQRNLLSGLLDSAPLSDIIEPAYRRIVSNLTAEQRERNCFMVNDRLDKTIVLYTPTGAAFAYTANDRPPLRYKSWNTESGPAWKSACVSLLGRVFYTDGSRVFKSGNTIFLSEKHHADRLNDRDADWTTGHSYSVGDIARDTDTDESYICVGAHISGGTTFEDDRTAQALAPKWELYEGEAIEFEMELPWLGGRNAMQVKHNKFVSVLTKGTAEFTFRVWVDNLYKDADGVVLHDPAVSMEFIGNDAPGFGFDAGPYGGGRRSSDPRLFRFPAKFKSIKPGIIGSARKPLEVASFTFLYARGKYHR